MESKEFRQFPVSQTIPEPPNDMAPSDTLYTNGYSSISGAPDQHLISRTI